MTFRDFTTRVTGLYHQDVIARSQARLGIGARLSAFCVSWTLYNCTNIYPCSVEHSFTTCKYLAKR
jgi:hypothetical protein